MRTGATLPTNSSEDASDSGAGGAPGRRPLAGRVVSAFGASLVGCMLPLTLILFGAALFQDGPLAAVFVLLFGLVPIAFGVWLAHRGTPGFWRRAIILRGDFWRMPGAAGVGIALVSLPLILVLREGGVFVALVALCLYPVLDVPRILARPSWWGGALVSGLVWLVVFTVVVGTVDAVQHLREDSMVFLLPFTMYPLVLSISGLVRLEGRLRGRPRESGPRTAAVLGGVACGLLVGVPVTLQMIPVVIEKITGNTPANTVLSGDGEVQSAVPGRVTVRLGGGRTESFRLGPETKFALRGPGSPLATGPAGPAWLEAGQRVGVEYVYRGGEAQAQRVNIWIERKGCAGDAKWAAASRQPPVTSPQAIPSLTGTTWEGWLGPLDAPGRHESTTFEFLAGNRLAYRDAGNPRYTNAAWRQDGSAVLIEVNDCYAEYEGRIEGDLIQGQFSNEVGVHQRWTARRNQGFAAATKAK